MTDVVCNYAILRFLPFRETGEFVNVGVIVYCPQTGFCEFKDEPERTERVYGFFPELDGAVFRDGLRGVKAELHRVARTLGSGVPACGPDLAAALARFRELVRPREGMFHFGGHGTVLAKSPEDGLDALYRQFVLRQGTRTAPDTVASR